MPDPVITPAVWIADAVDRANAAHDALVARLAAQRAINRAFVEIARERGEG